MVLHPPLEHEDTKRCILEALLALLASKPFSSITMNEIADACGLTKPAIYYHFGSKKGLFVALARMVQGEVRSLLDEVVAKAGSLREALVLIARRRMEALRSRPELVRAHIWMIVDPGIRLLIDRIQDEMADMVLEALRPLFEDARARGETREDVDAELVLRMHHGVMNTYLIKFLQGEPITGSLPDPEEIVDLIFRGIGPEEGCRA